MIGNPFIEALALVMNGATNAITSTIVQSNDDLYAKLIHKTPNASAHSSTVITNNTAIKAALNVNISTNQKTRPITATAAVQPKQIEAAKYLLYVKLNETTDMNAVRSAIRASDLLEKDGVNFESSRVKKTQLKKTAPK